MKKFDLNIEKVLENWEVYHAVREIIANALDEQALTQTREIDIYKDQRGIWHIRDYGRGLRYEHLTQKENEEKLNHPNLIGKFGVGLKDALATFDRRGINVLICSRYGDITLSKSEKHDFTDVITLHACVTEPSNHYFEGTEYILDGCSDDDIQKAKSLFLKFSGEITIEKTPYGEVLAKKETHANIYINGVKVAEEDNFLFSYNITSLTASIKKALNRERTNVGRSAYSDRVKSILLACNSREVAKVLIEDIQRFELGDSHDELSWVDVSSHAVKILNASSQVVFMTPSELMQAPKYVDEARSSGYEVVVIPETVQTRISGQNDISGQPIQDLAEFQQIWNSSFEFQFVDPAELTSQEKEVFDATPKILALIGGLPRSVSKIRISETMRMEGFNFVEAVGMWNPPNIIIKRSQLKSLEYYAATLLHEVAHAQSGAPDVSIEFERSLTHLLGKTGSNIDQSRSSNRGVFSRLFGS